MNRLLFFVLLLASTMAGIFVSVLLGLSLLTVLAGLDILVAERRA